MKHQPARQDFAPGKKAMIIPPAKHDVGVIVELMVALDPGDRTIVGGQRWHNPEGRRKPGRAWVIKSVDGKNLMRIDGGTGELIRNMPYANLYECWLMLIEPDNDQISDFVNEEVELTAYGY